MELSDFMRQESAVASVLTLDGLADLATGKAHVHIMMGQTFDEGQPVDMLKYAFFIMNLTDTMRQGSVPVYASWLIADHFISEINQEDTRERVSQQAQERIAFLQRVNAVYGGDITSTLSSQLSATLEYSRNLATLFAEAERNPKFKSLVLQAVPEDRRSNPSALSYPFEELATIQTMNTQIKVGPVYEHFYDEPAREFAPLVGFTRYVAIHLTNVFPLGSPSLPASLKEQIEQFGLLPYKKSSKDLGDFRIDPVNDDLDQTESLIHSTTDRRALVDLVAIAERAEQRLKGRSARPHAKAPGADLPLDELRRSAFANYVEFIQKHLAREAL